MTNYDKMGRIIVISGDNMKKNRKNVLIYLMALLVSLSFLNNKGKKKDIDNSTIDTSYTMYGTYKRGNVYICNSLSNVDKVYEVCRENDVVVVDQSENKDPNMKILASYKITDKEEMKEILNVIKDYCKFKNSNWDRSIYSMENEWIVHNICSNLSIKKDRTDDVDLNNSDEKRYNSKIVGKIIGNAQMKK